MKLNELPGLISENVGKLAEKFLPNQSQPGAFLRRFPSDSILKKADGIHQRKWFFMKARPFINVWFEGNGQRSVPAELIPMLAIGSTYENKKRFPRLNAKNVRLNVISEPKPTTTSSGVHWLRFRTKKGDIVRVRQLELARCLFLQNFHLARTAFRHNGLAGLAQVLESNDATIIKFPAMADYPPSNLRTHAALTHLSWVVLDKDARQSFGSILKFWMNSNSDTWNFRFKPPRLTGWHIAGSGDYGTGDASNIFTIDEITHFHNPVFSHPKQIVFDHPKFEELLAKDPANGKRPTVPRGDDDSQMDLSVEPLLGKRLDQVSDSGFSCSFDDNLKVGVTVNGRRYSVKPIADPESTPASETSSPGHATERGNGRELDYGINRPDESEDLSLEELTDVELTERFSIFDEVVRRLGDCENFSFERISAIRLPWPKGGNLTATRTATGKPIQACVSLIKYQSIPVVIIEVDTESIRKEHTLSTLVVIFSKNAADGVASLLRRCSNDGVHWDFEHIRSLNAVAKHSRHPHRQTRRNGRHMVVSPEDYLERWVNILERNIRALVKQVRKTS
ncbi:MAG: hypothetical protein KBT82_12845 [Marinobacter sp.]|uniref:Tn7-like element transposition protein TnsE n=1 Tax=Marinobacter sp. TaxID=50741 RepID=UPI001B6DBCDF|nr:Tn7-like element transposition protein TnsE [Marinobacter sp.]MBQ0745875.1 hypothetical protein [Marinobacter sp.]MBQ0815039.1 hypothetical protein [Marinobacter sp.]